jgi:hypothetical protein
LPKQLLEPVNDLAMPWKELRTPVDVCRRVDFVLLEPPGHAAGNGVGSITWILPAVQLDERVAKHRPFCRINRGDIATDSIPESHERTPHRNDKSYNFLRLLVWCQDRDDTIVVAQRCGTVILWGREDRNDSAALDV